MIPSCEMDIQGNTCHRDMISHLGICATTANTTTRITVVAGEREFLFIIYIPQPPPPSSHLSYLFICNAWICFQVWFNRGTRGWDCIVTSLVYPLPHTHMSLEVI